MAEILITIPEGLSDRLDKALASAAPEEAALSRSRLTRLIAEGAVTGPSGRVRDGKARAEPGGHAREAPMMGLGVSVQPSQQSAGGMIQPLLRDGDQFLRPRGQTRRLAT